ncbi:MAG: very short patch repair endonuclease [Syntrophobacteraceae bacterium]
MTDRLSPQQRSDNMRAVRSRDTIPEICVRRIAHRLSYRFRLHRADLPGKPDLVFPRLCKVIFVHGCFWHQHQDCRKGTTVPQTNPDFWIPKLKRNVQRDEENLAALESGGWKTLIVWECETENKQRLTAKLLRFLSR